MTFNLPTQYSWVLNDVRKDVDQQRSSAGHLLAGADKTEREVVHALDWVTSTFMRTGIADITYDLPHVPFKWSPRSPFSWVTYVKRLAEELRRPGIVVQEHVGWRGDRTSGQAWCVHIRKRAYTLPLCAWFFMLPKAQVQSCSRYWRFSVWSEQAEMIPQWREQCATDPEYRKALRLI